MTGLVTLLEANRPTVTTDDGISFLCYLRGRVKRDSGRIMVGDRVEIEPTDPGEGMILKVLPRNNTLLRPPMANITGLFCVLSLKEPQGNLELLDKRLVLAHLTGVEAEIVITKTDLLENGAAAEAVAHVYRQAGYPVWFVSMASGEGIEDFGARTRVGIWVMTGESGVGKSALLQAIFPDELLTSQALSRIGRGQQTTRYVRLLPIDSYWLADSPGYTSLQATVDSPVAIRDAFGEWRDVHCRFANCLHSNEPGCQVKEGVTSGRFDERRYTSYLNLTHLWVKR